MCRHAAFVGTEPRVSILEDYLVTAAKHFSDGPSKMMLILHLGAHMTVAAKSTSAHEKAANSAGLRNVLALEWKRAGS